MEQQVDFIALSFVREANDILELKELMGEKAGKIKIIAKIEDQSGVENIDEIIAAADGIMVARGDLGVEINVAELPNVQRRIVQLCAEAGKRVIVATHLLESMIVQPDSYQGGSYRRRQCYLRRSRRRDVVRRDDGRKTPRSVRGTTRRDC